MKQYFYGVGFEAAIIITITGCTPLCLLGL